MLEESTASETSALGVGTELLTGSKFAETTVGNAAVDLCSETPSDSSDSPQDSTIPTSVVILSNRSNLHRKETSITTALPCLPRYKYVLTDVRM